MDIYFPGGSFAKSVLPLKCKGVYYKRKEFDPTGIKFFPFRVDTWEQILIFWSRPFSEGVLNNFDRVGSIESVLASFKQWTNDQLLLTSSVFETNSSWPALHAKLVTVFSEKTDVPHNRNFLGFLRL